MAYIGDYPKNTNESIKGNSYLPHYLTIPITAVYSPLRNSRRAMYA